MINEYKKKKLKSLISLTKTNNRYFADMQEYDEVGDIKTRGMEIDIKTLDGLIVIVQNRLNNLKELKKDILAL